MPSLQARFWKMLMRRMFRKRMSIEEYRTLTNSSSRLSPPIPKGMDVHRFEVEAIPAVWISPAVADANMVILHLHGGGYVTGGIDSHLMMCLPMAQALKTRMLLFDYRLAPEHPFPAALEDGLKTYRWLLEQGYRPSDIVISGDSAGGGLALAVILSLRENGEPLPVGTICFSPWTDLTFAGESHIKNARSDVVITKNALQEWASAYTEQTNLRNPLVSPVFANFHGLPPLFIQVNDDELLLDDARLLAKKAGADGVDVTLKVWHGMWHVWHTAGTMIPESKKTYEEIGQFLKAIKRYR